MVDITEQSLVMKGIFRISVGRYPNGIQSMLSLCALLKTYIAGIGSSLHEEPLIPNYGREGGWIIIKGWYDVYD